MMTLTEQLVAKYRHELGGLVLDAATSGLHGAALSVSIRTILPRLDVIIAAIVTDAIRQTPSVKPVITNQTPSVKPVITNQKVSKP